MTTQNPFLYFWSLGYRSIIPVLPHDAEISETSHMSRAKDNFLGKAPGIRKSDGTWVGFGGWQNHQTKEADLEEWRRMGASVGLRLDDGLAAIDIDASDPDTAEKIERLALTILGISPCRVGRPPRRALLYKLPQSIRYRAIAFDGPDGEKEKIEILSAGKQIVVQGRHRKTGKLYEWPRRPVSFDELTAITMEQLEAFVSAAKAMLPRSIEAEEKAAADREGIDQEKLKAKDPDLLAEVVRGIPNNRDIYPDRMDYIRFGAALKAAFEDEDLAFELWCEWASKDDGGMPDLWEKDWKGLGVKFGIGAQWLYDEATKHGWTGSQHFDHEAAEAAKAEEPLFGEEKKEPREPIKWIRPSAWQGHEPPPREWEVEGWIPKGEVTLLYGDGGIGKTLVAHQYATSAAAGLNWLGQPTRKAKVMCFFCEDSEDELHRRQLDINRSLGLVMGDLDDNLRIASRKYLENLFVLWDRNTGAMKRQAVWDDLRADALEFSADVLILDTLADIYGGSEIDRAQVNSFVKTCMGRLAMEIGGSVLALGHPSMSGKSSGSGTSGSTAWNNAVRSRLYLRYPKGVDKGNVRELEGMKANYGPKGNMLKLRWSSGAFELLASASQPLRSDTGGAGASAGAGGVQSIEEAADDAVFSAVVARSDEPMSNAPNSYRYAPKLLKRLESDILTAFTVEEIEASLRRLERRRAVAYDTIGRKANRHPVQGYVAIAETANGQNVASSGGVFE